MGGASLAAVLDKRNARINLVDRTSAISITLFKLFRDKGVTEFWVLEIAELPSISLDERC